MFEFTSPLWLVAAAATGAVVLWCKEPPERKRVYGLSEIFERVPISDNSRYFSQMAMFLVFGTFLGLAMTNPSHVRQAFAAGLGWTAGFSTTRTAIGNRRRPGPV